MTKSVQNIFWNIYAKIRNNTTTTDRIYFCLVTVKRLRVESDAGTRCSLGSGWSLAPWSARTDLNKYAFFWKPEPVSESEVKMPWQRQREWTRRGVREPPRPTLGPPHLTETDLTSESKSARTNLNHSDVRLFFCHPPPHLLSGLALHEVSYSSTSQSTTATLGTPSSHNYLSLKEEDPSTILSLHRLRGLSDWFYTIIWIVLS